MPNMIQDFNPYPKSQQLAGHQKDKDTPKFTQQRFSKKKKKTKKPIVQNGIKIPSRAKRSDFTIKHKHTIIDLWGNTCRCCGNPIVEFHHRKFRSGMGRNNPRNGCPLCQQCHARCHTDAAFAQIWRDEAIKIWGIYYFWDKYDLWKHNLIERPTEELMDQFFEREREKCQKSIG